MVMLTLLQTAAVLHHCRAVRQHKLQHLMLSTGPQLLTGSGLSRRGKRQLYCQLYSLLPIAWWVGFHLVLSLTSLGAQLVGAISQQSV